MEVKYKLVLHPKTEIDGEQFAAGMVKDTLVSLISCRGRMVTPTHARVLVRALVNCGVVTETNRRLLVADIEKFTDLLKMVWDLPSYTLENPSEELVVGIMAVGGRE